MTSDGHDLFNKLGLSKKKNLVLLLVVGIVMPRLETTRSKHAPVSKQSIL